MAPRQSELHQPRKGEQVGDEGALPDPTAGADLWAAHAFAAIRGEDVPVLFDLPRTPPWKGAPDHLEGSS